VGASSAETLVAILKEQPTPPRQVTPDLPVELERILLRCLRKDPARRFQSMSDMKVELQEVKEESDSQAAAPAAPVRRGTTRRWWLALGVAGILLLVVATAATLWRMRARETVPPRVVRISSMRQVGGSSFSPDGSQIVFAAADERDGNWDLYLTIVGESGTRRLTTDPARDSSPAWSPDGRQIAFLRYDAAADSGAVFLVSPLGGQEHQLVAPAESRPSWSPDGRWLAIRQGKAIHVVAVKGTETHQVTSPQSPAFDTAPAFAPNGQSLAYLACRGLAQSCDVYVQPLDAQARAHGEPRRLTHQTFANAGLAWTRDGRSIVYGASLQSSRLWRVAAEGGAPPERVELAGPGAGLPASSIASNRLAFTRRILGSEIYRVEPGGVAAPILVSAFQEYGAQFSPDGRRIALDSGREDERQEIWLADAEGKNMVPVTRGPGRWQGSPRWSPDGRTIAFDAHAENGRFDIWTIGVDGAGLRQVTRDPANENMPSWSRDGRFVYYGSNRTGRSEIWRTPVSGGADQQVTDTGGALPFVSPDGATVYYLRRDSSGGLFARPSAGGPEGAVLSCVRDRGYAVATQGIFYITCRTPAGGSSEPAELRLWNPVTRRDQLFARLQGPLGEIDGLTASPDGRVLLVSSLTGTSELLMIEHFR
jgi:Tol biopolymer transport system component